MSVLTTGRLQGLTVAITGATGNVGTALLRRLRDSGVAEVRGLSRRPPPSTDPYTGVRWFHTDLGEESSSAVLSEFLRGADAVVHSAWLLSPDRDHDLLQRVNVEGTRRVMDAAKAAGVQHVVHLSSLGAYAAGPPDRRITEDWPATGVPSAQYSRMKVATEQIVRGRFEGTDTTVTMVRPTLVLQPQAASEIGRYFLGPLLLGAVRLVPGAVAKRLPLPLPSSLHLAFVHADDVGDAIVRMLDRRAPGAFNLAADPVLGPARIAESLGTVWVPVPAFAARAALQAAYLAHVVPIEPGWLDIGLGVPALDSTRAKSLLDWTPLHSSNHLLPEFVAALGRGDGVDSEILAPAGGPAHSPATPH